MVHHFVFPGLGDVTHERELTGINIPQFFTAFDNLNNPTKVSNGVLISEEYPRPDRVIWGYWFDMVDFSWDYNVNPSKSLT